MKTKKDLFGNLLLVVVSILLSLLLLEQSYRFYLFGNASFSIDKMNSIHGLGVSGLIKPSNSPEIIYELKPNLNTYFKLAKLKTNAKSLRDKEYELSRSDDIFRVSVIGDSFTLPSGVEIEDSFHSLLEEVLNKESRESTYEFINFAVGGYNLRQYLGVMKYKAHEYDPDLVLVGFCPANDHQISPEEIFQQQYKVKPATRPFLHSFVLEMIEQRIFTTNKEWKSDATVPSSRDEEKIYMSRIFSEMSTFGEKNNIPIVIMYLDYRHDEKYAAELESLVIDNGLYFLDLSLQFSQEDARKYRIYPTDVHPNEQAHRIFFEQLYGYLKQNNLLGINVAGNE